MAGIPKSMLSAQLIEFNQPYKIHEIPTPESLGSYDILLKVAVASLCHTDSMVSAGVMGTKLPCVGSHEGAGTVVQLGASVTNFKKGDRVMAGVMWNRCGHCSDCLGDEKYRHYCPNIAGHRGVTLDGAFAEYMIVDGRESAKIPDEVSFEAAAPLACAGRTVWRGILHAELTKGETLAIVGAGGGLGHLGCQFAKALGLIVIGIDAREEGLALAKDSGADVVIDARQEKAKVVGEVMKATNGMCADATVNVSDNAQAAALACAVTKMHGTMIQIAQPTDVSVPFHELVFRDVRIKGSLLCSQLEAESMLAVVATHNISIKTNPFVGLREVPKLIDLARGGKMQGKGVVIIDEAEIKRIKETKMNSS